MGLIENIGNILNKRQLTEAPKQSTAWDTLEDADFFEEESIYDTLNISKENTVATLANYMDNHTIDPNILYNQSIEASDALTQRVEFGLYSGAIDEVVTDFLIEQVNSPIERDKNGNVSVNCISKIMQQAGNEPKNDLIFNALGASLGLENTAFTDEKGNILKANINTLIVAINTFDTPTKLNDAFNSFGWDKNQFADYYEQKDKLGRIMFGDQYDCYLQIQKLREQASEHYSN